MRKSSRSYGETRKAGERFARLILKTRRKKDALVLGLVGELGAGKTTFLQGFARGLGVKEKITSPTFVVMKRFLPAGKAGNNFYHLDCYRIKKSKEILELGWKEIIGNPNNIVAVEWADKIKKIMPKETIWLSFEFINKNQRQITL